MGAFILEYQKWEVQARREFAKGDCGDYEDLALDLGKLVAKEMGIVGMTPGKRLEMGVLVGFFIGTGVGGNVESLLRNLRPALATFGVEAPD